MKNRSWIVSLTCLPICLAFALALSSAGRSANEKLDAFNDHDVVIAGSMSEEELIKISATLHAGRFPGVLLLDGPEAKAANADFLRRFSPRRLISLSGIVPPLPESQTEKELFLDGAEALARAVIPKAHTLVVCPAQPRALLLQAACLSGEVGAPLVVLHQPLEKAEVEQRVRLYGVEKLLAVGAAIDLCEEIKDVKVTPLADADAVHAAHVASLSENGPVKSVVVCNPADAERGLGRVSLLAPWIALQHHAPLLCTNAVGDDVESIVEAARHEAALQDVENVILAATLKAVPTLHRPNPVPGKDAEIEMEPFTPGDSAPFTFALGRVFHEDLGIVALLQSRQRLLDWSPTREHTALIVSNPGGGLALLESFSRNTAMELRNGGYATTARFDDQVNRDEIRRLLPEQDIFLWEGHYRTMVDQFELPRWTEPLRPALIFLQSCLALNEAEAKLFLQRGAIAVIGSSTRTYSGSGGAFTLAFFDAMMYEQQTLGGALRQSKNFLLAYSLLKEKRLGQSAKLSGANLRSSWAFSLWGDPTLRLPPPKAPAGAISAVQHEIKKNTITVHIPENPYPQVKSEKYQAQMYANCRLAGLVSKENNDDERHLVPLAFVEVPLKGGASDRQPHLTSKLPDRHWVFVWDARRRCGYLLIVPRKTDREIRFQVAWTG